MSDGSERDETRALWQSQSAPSPGVPVEVMRTRIAKIDVLMGRSKFAVILGGSFAFASFGWLLYTFPTPLQRIGGIIVLIAVALQIHQVFRLVVSTRTATGTVGTTASVVSYRAVLERQRQFHGGAGAWLRLITFSAGGLTFLLGGGRVDGWDREAVVAATLWVALALGVFINGRLQASRYEREIDEIDHLQSEES